MDKTKLKREQFIKTVLQNKQYLTRNRCDKCGRVDFCISDCCTMSRLCIVCMAQLRYPDPPKLDVADFASL